MLGTSCPRAQGRHAPCRRVEACRRTSAVGPDARGPAGSGALDRLSRSRPEVLAETPCGQRHSRPQSVRLIPDRSTDVVDVGALEGVLVRAIRLTAATSVAIILLSACSQDPEPSPPPTPVDSLSSSASTPPPEADTEAETQTQAPATTEAPPPDDSQTTTAAASGPPELPPEATEQTEAGAEAFVAYYFNRYNYGMVTPARNALSETAADGCQACAAFQESLVLLETGNLRSDGPVAELVSTDASIEGANVSVETEFIQTNPAVLTAAGDIHQPSREPYRVDFVFRLEWTEAGWRVTEID